MLTLLRVLVGLLSLLGLVAFALILLVGKGFEGFRSANVGSSRDLLPILVPCVLSAMLVSVFTPGARVFLHIVAVAVVLMIVQCALFVVPENTGEGLLYISFFGLWLLYYAMAAWVRNS